MGFLCTLESQISGGGSAGAAQNLLKIYQWVYANTFQGGGQRIAEYYAYERGAAQVREEGSKCPKISRIFMHLLRPTPAQKSERQTDR